MEEKYGEVEEMNVCDNLGDHLVGNVYVKVSKRPKSLICSILNPEFIPYDIQHHDIKLKFCFPSHARLSQFRYEEDAEKAVIDLNNRWFNGQPIHAELSPVTDFREACCRQYEMG